MPPEDEPEESWDQMAARVTAEEITGNYARQLWTSMSAYRSAGFTDEQAWELTLAEHASRMEYLGRTVMLSTVLADDDDDDEKG